jgi:hypothetical protein
VYLKAFWKDVLLIQAVLKAWAKPTLRVTVERLEKSHFKYNFATAAYAHSPARRIAHWVLSRPGLSVVICLGVYAFVFVASRYIEPGWLGLRAPLKVQDYYRDFANVSSGIVAAQATLVALVFPLAIALVALFFEARTPTSGRLSVFFHETAAVPIGCSSLLLCGVTAAQLPGYAQFPLRTTAALTILNLLWFLLNVAALTFFLLKAFQYVRPETRKIHLYRFAINVAWREELRRLMAFTHLMNANHFGHLPKTVSPNSIDNDDGENAIDVRAKPEVRVSSIFGAEGPGESIFLPTESVLVDVNLPLLAVVAHQWLVDADNAHSDLPVRSAQPTLTFLPLINESYAGEVRLVTWTATPLSRLQRYLVRRAYRFRRPLAGSVAPTTGTLLKEAMADIITIMEQGRTQEFDAKLDDLVELHVLFFKIAETPKELDQGTFNYSQLSFGWKSVGDVWATEYRDLFKRAVHKLRDEPEFFSHCAYLASRLYAGAAEAVPPGSLGSVSRIAFHLFWRLHEWAALSHKAETGLAAHAGTTFQLRAEAHEIYSEAWRNFVAGWERLANHFYRGESTGAGDAWRKLAQPLEPLLSHLDDTAVMVAMSAWSGDLLGVRWSTDLLLRWLDANEGRWTNSRSSWALDRSFVTTELLKGPWANVRPKELSTVDGVEVGPAEVFAAAVANRWTDTLMVLSCKLLSWGGPDALHGAAFIAAKVLIANERYDESSSRADISPFPNVDAALGSILRIAAAGDRYSDGYSSALNRLVERLHDVSRKPWVSLRVYSSTGSHDFFDLPGEQVALLAARVPNGNPPAGLPTEIARYLRSLVDRPDEMSRRVQAHLEDLLARVPQLKTERFEHWLSALRGGDDIVGFPNWLASTERLLRLCLELLTSKRAERIRSARVDPERLLAIAQAASASGFTGTTGRVPINLFEVIGFVDEPLDQFTISHSRYEKGEITNPPMAQPVSNEASYWRDHVRDAAAGVALSDLLRAARVEEIEARTPLAWWDAVRQEASSIRNSGGKPLLLISSTVEPSWLYDWIWDRNRASVPCPEDLRLWEDPEVSREGYELNLNDIEAYQAMVEDSASYLLPASLLRKIEFSVNRDGLPVDATFEADPVDPWRGKLNVSWRRRLTLGDGKIVCIRHGGDWNVPGPGTVPK